MSSKYTYIDIVVNVMEGGLPATTCATEGAPSLQLPSLNEITSHFSDLTEGYLLWNAGGRRGCTYFSLDRVSGQPKLSVTLLADNNVLLAGRQVVMLLSAIKSRVFEGEALTPDTFDRLIRESGMAEQPLRCDDDGYGDMNGTAVAYRTYASPGELSNIIGFPRQKPYTGYHGVVVVPATAEQNSGDNMPQITVAVDKALMVVCPEGVSASAQRVRFSDHLTVTYRCPGFDPVSVMFEVGTTNRYVRINGPALIVNSAAHAGIVFRRRVPYNVITTGGQHVDTYTILINGRTANRTEEGFEVANTDFENGIVRITVSSTNFSSYSNDFSPESLEAASPLEVVLEPESRDILLRLDFGDGRVVEEHLNIEKNTPEYCRLRAGSFHGFRAHRLMGSKPETYNIDVRPTSTPAAKQLPVKAAPAAEPVLPFDEKPAAEPADTTVAAEAPVAPVIEKAPSAIHHEEKTERCAPKFVNETLGETEQPAEPKYNIKRIATIGAFALLAILAVWWIAGLISGSGDSTPAADSTAVAAQAVQKGAAGPAAQAAPSAAEQTDIDYLNSNSVWVRSELKTAKYQALYDAFTQGDIDAIASNEYFAVKDRAKNDRANKLMNNLWNAKGSIPGKKHPGVLKKFDYSKGLDLYKLNNAIAVYMPKEEEYNKAPRPRI